VIELRDIHFKYPGGNRVLRDVNLTIERNEFVLVCGANGSGKSTLGYLLNGLIPHFIEGDLRGSVIVDGCDTRNLRVADLAKKVGLVLQNPEAQLFHSTVADDIAFVMENTAWGAADIHLRVAEVAASLHIEHLLKRSPGELSGGEKRLAAIASVLAAGPSVIVLDEPYADLDHDGVVLVRQELSNIHRQGKTVVVIEQRLDAVLPQASRCLLLEDGQIVFHGGTAEVEPLLLEKGLIPRYPRRKPRKSTKTHSLSAATNLCYCANGKRILHDVSLQIRQGESIAIIGKNGAGKTTLIKHLNALLHPSQGVVTFQGQDIRWTRTNELAAEVGLCFQNPNDQFFKVRVRDELMVGPHMIGRVDEEWIEKVCRLFQLGPLLDRSPYRLSEGEKKRVAFASIFSMRPGLVILDEPTVGQDGCFKEALVSFLRVLEGFGFTLIIVTHDLELARATTDRWIVLHDGRIVADGPPEYCLAGMNSAALSRESSNMRDGWFEHDGCTKVAHS
jgi:energy-coupling factor transport system ATP-binding protein